MACFEVDGWQQYGCAAGLLSPQDDVVAVGGKFFTVQMAVGVYVVDDSVKC